MDRSQEKAICSAKPSPEAPIPSSPADAAKVQKPPTPLPVIPSSQVLATEQPPPLVESLARDPFASPDALEEALFALARLWGDLQGAHRRLVVERLELISS